MADVQAKVRFAGHVGRDHIEHAQGGVEMLDVGNVRVFDAEIVHDEGKR